MKRLDPHWRGFLNSPVWYVATVTSLAILASNVRPLWWLAGVVALAWGTWLVWRLFTQDNRVTESADQLKGYLDQTMAYQAQIDQLLKTTSNASNRAQRLHLREPGGLHLVRDLGLVSRVAQ